MSHTQQAHLTVAFQGYWHTGSGTGAGHHVDALCLKDPHGLPYVPGRQLKGLLRHAVRRAEQWGWLPTIPATEQDAISHEEMLFGSSNQQENRYGTHPGMLLVDNATLPDAEYQWVAHEDNANDREQLFTELFNTAINEDGTAQNKSLRGMEVCLPVTLHAELTLEITALQPQRRQSQEQWLKESTPWQILTTVLPLIDAVGANRSRGLGEAILTLDANHTKGAA